MGLGLHPFLCEICYRLVDVPIHSYAHNSTPDAFYLHTRQLRVMFGNRWNDPRAILNLVDRLTGLSVTLCWLGLDHEIRPGR